MGETGAIDVTAALALGVYMLALVGVGAWASRRARSSEDFLLGGRALGPIVSGLAYAATTSSAWVLLGFTAFVANAGVSALWMIPGILGGYALVWLWIGGWVNDAARREGWLTALDVLAADARGPLRASIKFVAALMIVFCFSFYIAAQFDGAGTALAGVLGVDKRAAILIGAGVILAYTFLGGFWAVALTDTVQGLAILGVALIVPFAALSEAGGLAGVGEGLARAGDAFQAPFGTKAGFAALGVVAGLLAIGVGALGQPHLITWVMAARDRPARLQGAAVAIFWGALVYAGMATIGLSARAMAGAGATIGESAILDIAHGLLPGILPALVTAAILSAIMSTVDAQLLVASAAASHDLSLSRLAKGREVLVTRAVILALSAAAVAVSLAVPASIFSRVLFAWTALGAAFGPTLVAMAARRRPAPLAILLAMIIGFSLAVYFNQFAPPSPGAWTERILPWIAGLIVVFAFSKPSVQGA